MRRKRLADRYNQIVSLLTAPDFALASAAVASLEPAEIEVVRTQGTGRMRRPLLLNSLFLSLSLYLYLSLFCVGYTRYCCCC